MSANGIERRLNLDNDAEETAMTIFTPRDLARQAEERTAPWPGEDERYAGYGVMGLPLEDGHYLAFRRFPSTPTGRPYTSVWLRSPDGRWTLYVDASAEYSCPRYFDAAIESSVLTEITVDWTAADGITITIPDLLVWQIALRATPATAMMTAMASRLPGPAWESPAVLAAMGRMAGPMLGVGRVRLAGILPNGQWFKAGPRRVWSIGESTVRLNGSELKPVAGAHQPSLGDFWLPRTGLFMMGCTIFEAFDPTRHKATRPALTAVGR